MCPLYKTVGMMKAICTYYDQAKKAITESANRDTKLNWVTILNQTKPLYMRLTRFKFESPKKSQQEFNQEFDAYCDEVIAAFRNFND